MSRDSRLLLEDIQTSCQKILRYTDGVGYIGFMHDERTFDAVLRNLEVIGEAARNLPEDIISANPQVEWPRIVGFRNVIAHKYFGVEPEIVWDIVPDHIPRLLSRISEMLAAED